MRDEGEIEALGDGQGGVCSGSQATLKALFPPNNFLGGALDELHILIGLF